MCIRKTYGITVTVNIANEQFNSDAFLDHGPLGEVQNVHNQDARRTRRSVRITTSATMA